MLVWSSSATPYTLSNVTPDITTGCFITTSRVEIQKDLKSYFDSHYFNVKSSYGINEDLTLRKAKEFISMNSNYILVEIFCCINSNFDPGNTPNQIYPSLAINEMCNYITACCCHLEN